MLQNLEKNDKFKQTNKNLDARALKSMGVDAGSLVNTAASADTAVGVGTGAGKGPTPGTMEAFAPAKTDVGYTGTGAGKLSETTKIAAPKPVAGEELHTIFSPEGRAEAKQVIKDFTAPVVALFDKNTSVSDAMKNIDENYHGTGLAPESRFALSATFGFAHGVASGADFAAVNAAGVGKGLFRAFQSVASDLKDGRINWNGLNDGSVGGVNFDTGKQEYIKNHELLGTAVEKKYEAVESYYDEKYGPQSKPAEYFNKAIYAIGNMIPSLLISSSTGTAAVNTMLSIITLGSSAEVEYTKNALDSMLEQNEQARREGLAPIYSETDMERRAALAGTAGFLIEGVGEQVIGGTLGLGYGLLDSGFAAAAKKLGLKSFITNPVVRTLLDHAVDYAGEGLEEVGQDILSGFASNAIYNSGEKIFDWEELGESFIVGALMSVISGAPNVISDTRSGVELARAVKDFSASAGRISNSEDAATVALSGVFMSSQFDATVSELESMRNKENSKEIDRAIEAYTWAKDKIDGIVDEVINSDYTDKVMSANAAVENGTPIPASEAQQKAADIQNAVNKEQMQTAAVRAENPGATVMTEFAQKIRDIAPKSVKAEVVVKAAEELRRIQTGESAKVSDSTIGLLRNADVRAVVESELGITIAGKTNAEIRKSVTAVAKQQAQIMEQAQTDDAVDSAVIHNASVDTAESAVTDYGVNTKTGADRVGTDVAVTPNGRQTTREDFIRTLAQNGDANLERANYVFDQMMNTEGGAVNGEELYAGNSERDAGNADRGANENVSAEQREAVRSETERTTQSRIEAAASSEAVSSIDLGDENGTETKNLRVIPESSYDAELLDLQKKANDLGAELVVVTGSIETEYGAARGFYTDGRIVIRGDHPRLTATQIFDHESFHLRSENDSSYIDAAMENIRNNYDEAYIDSVVDDYFDVLAQATGGDPEALLELAKKELLADAYAGINYAGLNADKLTDEVRTATDTLDKRAEAVKLETDIAPPTPEAEVQRNPLASSEVVHSFEENDRLMEEAEKTAEENNVSLSNARSARSEIRSLLNNLYKESKIPQDGKLRKDRLKKDKRTIESGPALLPNGSYGFSAENVTICYRSLATDAFVEYAENKMGRFLSYDERLFAAQQVGQYFAQGDELQCAYCYVAADRMAYGVALHKFFAEQQEVFAMKDSGLTASEIMTAMNQKYDSEGKKFTDTVKERIEEWISNDKADCLTEAEIAGVVNSEESLKRYKDRLGTDLKRSQFDLAVDYAHSASHAKTRIYYDAYNGTILRLTPEQVQELNSEYGLRMYSYSDFSPAFILENMQMVTDAAAKGLKVLAYTKELDFVRIFAGTGMNINVSVYGEYVNGEWVADEMQGAKWEEAKALREKYPNVGITFVVTDDASKAQAMKEDWVDVVLPYHSVFSGGSNVAKILGYSDYKSQQEDKKIRGQWEFGDMKGVPPTVHGNDLIKYVRACQENHLMPRFHEDLNGYEEFIDGGIDEKTFRAMNPYYMKLVNETRRSYTDTPPVQSYFSREAIDAAKNSIEGLEKSGGYNPPLGKDLTLQQDIYDDLLGDIKSGEYENKIVKAQNRETLHSMDDIDTSTYDDEQFKNYEFNKANEIVGTKLKTLKGSDIKRYKNIVGKEVGGQIYLHKDYALDVVPSDKYEQAKKILEETNPGFQYNTIMYDPKKNTIRFDSAENFDTAREPRAGQYVSVNLKNGSANKDSSEYIWHHKWLWVKNDYTGFDVADSWNWSKKWLSVLRPVDPATGVFSSKGSYSGIANGSGNGPKFWNEQLEYFGLPVEKQKTFYSLDEVDPVQSSDESKWMRGTTGAEIRANPAFADFRKNDPNRTYVEDIVPNESARRENRLKLIDNPSRVALKAKKGNGTQIAGTISTYQHLWDSLEHEGFTGTVLDASSGMGLGTDAGLRRGFDVEDIEPYPGEGFTPTHMDYSRLKKQYDVVVSNAVVNVLTQEDADAYVSAIGNLLKPGGRAYIAVRNRSGVLATSGGIALGKDPSVAEIFVPGSQNYQRGYTAKELAAYVQDVLGDGFTVTVSPKLWRHEKGGKVIDRPDVWGDQSVLVEKKSSKTNYSLDEQSLDDFTRAFDAVYGKGAAEKLYNTVPQMRRELARMSNRTQTEKAVKNIAHTENAVRTMAKMNDKLDKNIAERSAASTPKQLSMNEAKAKADLLKSLTGYADKEASLNMKDAVEAERKRVTEHERRRADIVRAFAVQDEHDRMQLRMEDAVARARERAETRLRGEYEQRRRVAAVRNDPVSRAAGNAQIAALDQSVNPSFPELEKAQRDDRALQAFRQNSARAREAAAQRTGRPIPENPMTASPKPYRGVSMEDTPVNLEKQVPIGGAKDRTALSTKVRNTAERAYELLRNDVQGLDNFGSRQTRAGYGTTASELTYAARHASGATASTLTDSLRTRDGGTVLDSSFADKFLCRDPETGKFSEPMQKILQQYCVLKLAEDSMSIERRAWERVDAYVAEHPWIAEFENEELRTAAHFNDRYRTEAKEFTRLVEYAENAKNKDVLADVDGAVIDEDKARKLAEIIEREQPWVVEKANGIYEWYDKFMQEWAVGGGLITREDYDRMREQTPHYIPAFREGFGNDSAGGISINGGNVSVKSITKERKGSVREIKWLQDTFADNVSKIITTAKFQELCRNLIDTALLDDTGAFADMLTIESVDLDAGGLDRTDSVRAGKDLAEGKLVIWENGERITATITSPELKRALMALSGQNRSEAARKILQIGTMLTKPMKTLITGANPAFGARNVLRDIGTAIMNTDGKPSDYLKYWLPAASAVFGDDYGANAKYAEIYNQWKALGGGDASIYRSEEGFVKYEKSLSEKNAAQKVGHYLFSWMDNLEQASRFAEYLRYVETNGNTYENRLKALKASAEITTDFSRNGELGRIINAWIPYWNPGKQGTDKFLRKIVENKATWQDAAKAAGVTLTRGLAVAAAPEILAYLLVKLRDREDEWMAISDYQKDNYFMIPTTDHKWLRIPKTPLYGMLLGTPIRRGIEAVFEGRKDAFKDYDQQLLDAFSLPSGDNAVEAGLSEIRGIAGIGQFIDLGMNEDFAGRAIVANDLAKLSPEYQYDSDTSALAYAVGETLGRAFKTSPEQVDYLLYSYLGDFWSGVNGMIDLGLISGEKTLGQNLATMGSSVGKSFVIDDRYSNRYSSEYYDMLDELSQRISDSAKSGEDEQQLKDLKDGINALFGKEISDAYKRIRNTTDPVEKDDLRQRVSDLAQQAVDYYRNADEHPNAKLEGQYKDYSASLRNELIRLKDYNADYKFEPSSVTAPAKLSDAQKTQFKSVFRQEYERRAKELMNSAKYKKAKDKKKAELLEGVYSDARNYAQKQVKK